jgi:cell wall-associated NlpC family hydrolase
MTPPHAAVSHGLVSPVLVMAEARTWIDVPIFHRGRSRAGGVDCLGLVIGTGVGSGAADDPNEAAQWWREYSRVPNPRILLAGLAELMVPIEDDQAGDGDVVTLSWGERGLAQHLAILATFEGRRTIIHADPRARPARVVEVTFAAEWPDRVCNSWRYPRMAV